MPTPEWVDKVKGKKLLDVRPDPSLGMDYGAELEFEGGIILNIWIVTRYYDDAILDFEVKDANTE